MQKLIDANLHFLQQAADLVERLEDSCYARCEQGFYNSSIGAHLRHCLEHYQSFFVGLAEGKIDYDMRKRDERVEQETGAAQDQLNQLKDNLTALAKNDDLNHQSTLMIKMDCGEDCSTDNDGDSKWQASTLGRELQFLVSHTVHHFAMIKGLCFSHDTDICSTFGLAPSTLRHRQTLEQNTA